MIPKFKFLNSSPRNAGHWHRPEIVRKVSSTKSPLTLQVFAMSFPLCHSAAACPEARASEVADAKAGLGLQAAEFGKVIGP